MTRRFLLLAAWCVWLNFHGHVTNGATINAKPNILIILADDMGYSDPGCYGGEIQTPNLDKLAQNGLRFTQFYNTGRCWPTRSSLLTGYYARAIRSDPPVGRLPSWTRLLPQHLKPAGYRSYHSGKWHVKGAPNPCADGGFDRSYEMDDHDRYFNPQKHRENDRAIPAVKPGTDYYVTSAIADHAIRCLKEHSGKHAEQPFFSYVAFTSPHFPLHALSKDIEKYRDQYLKGWDSVHEERWRRLRQAGIASGKPALFDPGLSPRYFKDGVMEELGPGEVKHAVPWQSLTPEQKKYQATKMAIHAAMVDRMDQEVGKLIAQLRAMNALENTIVFFLSDNGADATLLVRGDRHDQSAKPGSAASYLCLGPGWASASNTPFRRHKVWVNEGGISTPLIVHWPQGIRDRGELRHDAGHVIDLVPTVLELAGVSPTATWKETSVPALQGKSLVPAFRRDNVLDRDFLFFHHEGNRALHMDKWKLVSAREDDNRWELFDLKKDRGETVNLATKQPKRVAEMESRWKTLEAEFRRMAEGN